MPKTVAKLANPHLQIALCAFLFATGGVAIKSTQLDSWQVAAARSAIGAAVLVAMIPAARRAWTWRVWMVAAMQALTLLLFVHANKLTTAANAILLQSTAPLHVLWLAPLALGERLRRRDLATMLGLSLGAAAFFLGARGPLATASDPPLGNRLALLSGLTWGLTIVGLRWQQRAGGEDRGWQTVVCGNLLACLLALPMALPVTAIGGRDLAIVAYLGVFQVALAYAFMAASLRALQALETSLMLLLEPVLSTVLAWLLIREAPGPWSLAGGALILATTAVHSWLGLRRTVPAGPRL